MTTCRFQSYCDWRDLPFREIWCVDTEFYPGAGFANGGVNGDPVTPLCLVAYEMRSGRLIRQWQDELGPFAPYPLGNEALIAGYMLAAEFGFHTAKSWGEPACALDLYVEFRHIVNDGSVKSGDREKGFYSIDGALRYFCEDGLHYAHNKDESRDRILQGPPFSRQERRNILGYNEDDTRKTALLLSHIVPTIRSLEHAMFRAKFQWAIAQYQHRGIPTNRPQILQFRHHWNDMKLDLVTELDRPFGCYEIADGKAHWRKERFLGYVQRNRMSWPRLESGALDERDQTFREMAGKYPQIEQLRELRYSLSKLRLNDLAIGSDGRNRASLWAFGTKTGRCAPGASEYIFGPAKWTRHFIAPPPGRVLVHRDYAQQEVRIAALLSNDAALLAACESGDVYDGIAEQLGFVRESMNETERAAVRDLFKTVVLGIMYRLGHRSLAVRTGISEYEAREILLRLRARFHRFEDYLLSVLDHAGLLLEIGTPYGWYLQCPPATNPRTICNFPIQSTGSEILHVLGILGERRGLEIVAPVHDAVMVEGPLSEAEEISRTLDKLMGDASAVVLRGYRLPTDKQVIRPGQTYTDKRGAVMWATVLRLIAKLERERA